MADRLSLLNHSRCLLAKTWRADGSIKDYDNAKYFSLTEVEVDGIGQLSALMSNLGHLHHSCFIRGKYKGDNKKRVRRIIDEFGDQPLHTLMIEVDKYEPLCADPIADPVSCIEEYMVSELPESFRGVSYHWQLSSSAGHPSKRGTLRVHLWFWLEEAASSAQLKAWQTASGVCCDKAVFNEVQIHYTAAPVFEEGVTDPVAMRSGFVAGLVGDSVALKLPAVAEGEKRLRERGQDDGVFDEVVEHLKVLGEGRDGALYIECPFKDGHSTKGGVSETAYYPAGTGGFQQGHFKCMHTTCGERYTDADFIAALGIVEAGFDIVENIEMIGGDIKPVVSAPKLIGTKAGFLPTLTNLERVIQSPSYFGEFISYDNFKGELVTAEYTENGKQWRQFTDNDYTRIRLDLEKKRFQPLKKDIIRDAVNMMGERTSIDSAIQWISALEWDGVSRIDTFLPVYFGAEDTDYVKNVSQYMWTALAGRVLSPGIKADIVPVLVGNQGIGKSTGISELVPDHEFYTTVNLSERDDNLKRRMMGKLVLEIAELRGLYTRDNESIKDFISHTHDRWSPKFVEKVKNYPRRSLFIGTTNQQEFLADPTGNRRWAPVRVVRKVDVNLLRRDRLLIWAEAAVLFNLFGVMYSGVEKGSSLAHEKHRIHDLLTESVDDWLDATDSVTGECPKDWEYIKSKDIVIGLGMDIRTIKRVDEMKIAAHMRELNFNNKIVREGARTFKAWFNK